MLLNYFGFREDPFGVTPDPRFIYEAKSHREALASLVYGIGTGRGFMALLAEPGMGKTSLLHGLLERLQQTARTAYIFQTQCNSRELLGYLLTDFEVNYNGHDRNIVAMHQSLNEVLLREARQGRRCVAVIDEAQNLDHEVLESVRLLSDFETGKSKLLQIVLAGQPALAEKLSSPSQEQLRQRISSMSWLVPLNRTDVSGYIAHRLRVAGYLGAPLFTPEAEKLIAEHSQGIPRNINNLCFNSLSQCCAERKRQVEGRMVEEVLADLSLLRPRRADELEFEQVGSDILPHSPSSVTRGPRPTTTEQPKVGHFPSASTSSTDFSGQRAFAYTRESTARAAMVAEKAQPRPIPVLAPVPLADYAAPKSRNSEFRHTLLVLVAVVCTALGAAAWYFAPSLKLSGTLSPTTTEVRESSAPATPAPEASDSFPSTDNLTREQTLKPETEQLSGSQKNNPEQVRRSAVSDEPLETEDSVATVPRKTSSVLTPGMGSYEPRTEGEIKPPDAIPTTASSGRSALPVNGSTVIPLYRPATRPSPPEPSYIAQSSIAATTRNPISVVRPVYPSVARSAKVSGEVQMEALIGQDGNVKDVRVVSGHPMLIYAATDAVRKWRFEPLKINGRAVEFNTRVTIKFSLSGPNS